MVRIVLERFPLVKLPQVLQQYPNLVWVHYDFTHVFGPVLIAMGILAMVFAVFTFSKHKTEVANLVGICLLGSGLIMYLVGLWSLIAISAITVYLAAFFFDKDLKNGGKS